MSEEVGLPEERHEHGGRARHHALLRRATHVPAGILFFLLLHFLSPTQGNQHFKKYTVVKFLMYIQQRSLHSETTSLPVSQRPPFSLSRRDRMPPCLPETAGLLVSQRFSYSFPFYQNLLCFSRKHEIK